ncbi:MAG: Ribosomal RNA small subunit methyltransferase A [Alphaproteobacteria bacterium MarineAlpha8_Bin1]|nr:MAG: Ribosomal RNA small subunit methyltransferase A [Alphaproteobacteria bacterium MarineAlpha8_Bin1]
MVPFRIKKELGQHFLNDKETLERISVICNLKKKLVIEIGPGKGSLSRYILKRNPLKLILIEKDTSLRPYLSKIKQDFPNLIEIIFADALNLKLNKIFPNKISLVANLPYNIATTLIINWLRYIQSFESIVVMVQKEVAERLTAKVSSKFYSRLSVLVQVHANVKKILDIDPTKFNPQPKVNSTVIKLVPKKIINFNYEKLDQILKICFSQRRKMIKKNLKKINLPIKKFCEDNKINLNLRPQDIEPKNYLKMSELSSD